MPIIYRNNCDGNSAETEKVCTVTTTGYLTNPNVYEFKEGDDVVIVSGHEVPMKGNLKLTIVDSDENNFQYRAFYNIGSVNNVLFSTLRLTMPNKNLIAEYDSVLIVPDID